MGLGETKSGFLVVTVSPEKPMYITCSDGVVELYVDKVRGKFKLRVRANSPKIDFHRNEERMRRALANSIHFNIEEGNGPV